MTIDWDKIRQNARAPQDVPKDWPKGVRAISQYGIALLGIDDANQLYWDGQPIEIQRRLKLSRFQIIGALVVGVATVIGGVSSGLNDGFDFGCKMHWWIAGCSP